MRFLRWIGRYSAWILTIIFGTISLLEIAQPLLSKKFPTICAITKFSLSFLCHQNPQRCFWVFGNPMGLCARCTGIFFGLTFFGIVAIVSKMKKGISFIIMALLLAPLVIDGTGHLLGLWDTSNAVRFITGVLSSFGIVFFVYPIILNANIFGLENHDKEHK